MSVRAYGQLIIQATPPAEAPVMVGTLWLDTDSNALKRCTSVTPYAFASVEGVGAGGAPAGASYLVLSANTDLTNERVLTQGTNISFTDNGPGGTFVINSTNTGTAYFPAGW